MDGKQGEEETANLTVSNAIKADKKPIRSLIPIDFGSSKDDTNSYSQKKKTDNRNSLLHSDGMSSSEDEWNRNDNAIHLSEAGRNIKRQLKEEKGNHSNSAYRMQSMTRQKLSVQENRHALQGKAQQITKAVESSSKDALKVYDQFFGIRIRNPTLSSAAFELYCEGLKKIRLSQLKSCSQLDNKWISLAVIVEKTGCLTVKLTKCAQVLELGFCPDFGRCKAVKKDGGLCQNVVNLSQCERCIYHVQRAAQKFTANRGSFASILSNPNRKLPLQESNSFSSGIITMPRRAPTNTLSINESRKNFKQQQVTNCLMRSQSLKECEKMKLDALIAKEVAIFGTKSASQPHGKVSGERSDKSLKEFLQKQDESKNSMHSPVLGKGLNSGSVLLISPRKINKLSASENAKVGEFSAIYNIIIKITEFEYVYCNCLQRKAIATIKKIGGLEKADPNSINGKPKKRLSPEHKRELKMKPEINVNFDENSKIREFSKKTVFTDDEILALLKKRSNHESDLRREDSVREGRYFNAMEQKERFENYLTNTMEIRDCNVFTCTQCNYTSHKQSDLCKQLNHTVKQCKANKRFFRCKQCHRRTVSYERLPTVPCTQCGCNDFQRVAMKDERRVKLAQENLLLRGEERKYINC
uniref:Protein MCM10 homolog n=1 Tax=Wuchereria bancrofti TaxID=6293 RepID=A0A1I8EM93_WUCBA